MVRAVPAGGSPSRARCCGGASRSARGPRCGRSPGSWGRGRCPARGAGGRRSRGRSRSSGRRGRGSRPSRRPWGRGTPSARPRWPGDGSGRRRCSRASTSPLASGIGIVDIDPDGPLAVLDRLEDPVGGPVEMDLARTVAVHDADPMAGPPSRCTGGSVSRLVIASTPFLFVPSTSRPSGVLLAEELGEEVEVSGGSSGRRGCRAGSGCGRSRRAGLRAGRSARGPGRRCWTRPRPASPRTSHRTPAGPCACCRPSRRRG